MRPMTSCPKVYNNKPVLYNKILTSNPNSNAHIQNATSPDCFDCLDVRKVKVLVFYTTTPDIKSIFNTQDLKF